MNGPLPPNGAPASARGSGLPPSPPMSIAARSSNGGSPYLRGGPDGPLPGGPMPGGPMPPGSAGRGGPPGPGGPRKYDPRALEAQLAEHHRVLKDYLANSLREENGYIPHNRARDKLLRLSPIQFQELSTDVYDELLRREDERAPQGQNVPPYLPPRNNFHPKRNQARQKLSTLATKKFRELATDVLFELERRFPRFTGAERLAGGRGGSRPGTSLGIAPPPIAPGMRRPSNASSIGPYSPGIIDAAGRGTPGPYSNTMVPNKGMMVEDDDDHSGDDDEDPYDLERSGTRFSRRTTNKSFSLADREHPLAGEYQTQISELEAKLAALESQVQEKDKAVESERERSSVLTENLERQLKTAEGLNGNLQSELDRLRASSASDDWRVRYESLEQEFADHRQVTEDVRHGADASLSEMRALATQISTQRTEEDRLTARVSSLEGQLDAWRTRHAKTQAHLRSLKASSMADFIAQPAAPQFAAHNALLDPRGGVRDTILTTFQLAIDELLRLARADAPASVLQYMRAVVAAVRGVTGDVAANAGRADDARKKLEARIAAATNNLITTAKNHALAGGLAPLSLLDAAAAHVTLAVIELVKVVKVRPSEEGELLDDYS